VGDQRREAPSGSRPSYSLGITERDNDFYKFWDKMSRDRDQFTAWMNENVLGKEVSTR
jgi:glutaconate CoA-transferase, subunit A